MEKGEFHYVEWQDLYKDEKPFQILIDLPGEATNKRTTNLVFSKGIEENIQDVREQLSKFDLDIHGFVHRNHPTRLKMEDFADKAKVENIFLPECEAILKDVMDGVDQVYFYNWLLRDTDQSSRDGKVVDLNDPLAKLGPSQVVHIDQTDESAVERVFRELPSQADFLLGGRLRLVNLWRPINGPLETWPLALCDGRTISPDTLVATERIRRTYTGGTTFLLHEPHRKWYYLSQQSNDEVAVFKCFDSKAGVTKYSAHSSFLPSSASPQATPRQSIEVRAMVFTYPK